MFHRFKPFFISRQRLATGTLILKEQSERMKAILASRCTAVIEKLKGDIKTYVQANGNNTLKGTGHIWQNSFTNKRPDKMLGHPV